MHADGIMVEVIAVVNDPSGIFALLQQGVIIFPRREFPKWFLEEVNHGFGIIEVEGGTGVDFDVLGVPV